MYRYINSLPRGFTVYPNRGYLPQGSTQSYSVNIFEETDLFTGTWRGGGEISRISCLFQGTAQKRLQTQSKIAEMLKFWQEMGALWHVYPAGLAISPLDSAWEKDLPPLKIPVSSTRKSGKYQNNNISIRDNFSLSFEKDCIKLISCLLVNITPRSLTSLGIAPKQGTSWLNIW